MRPKNAAPSTLDARPAWEAPAFTKSPIAARTKSPKAGDDPAPVATEPAEPGRPVSKLGFSFEMAFPMSSRSEK
jgi:hypothetical protein